MHKKLLYFISGLVALLLIMPAVLLGPFAFRIKHMEANPGLGFHADYYLYISPDAHRTMKGGGAATMLVQPNNSGTNSDDPEVHRKDAWWMTYGRHYLANDLGVVLLIPAFLRPAEDWHIYTHALDRDVFTTQRDDLARLDLQLLSMVDHAKAQLAQEDMQVRDKFLIQGYSASGMFANRFALLHPQHLLGVAAGSPGGWPAVPLSYYQDESLPFPIGVADIEVLTGQPFDSTGFSMLPHLIVMGALDENDSVDFSDGWDEPAAAQVNRQFGETPRARWHIARALYDSAGVNAHFLLIDGIGHDRKALQSYSTAFLKEILAETD